LRHLFVVADQFDLVVDHLDLDFRSLYPSEVHVLDVMLRHLQPTAKRTSEEQLAQERVELLLAVRENFLDV
jgi:hypothetical protein